MIPLSLLLKGNRMQIKRNGSKLRGNGKAEYFKGRVLIFPLYNPTHPSRVTMDLVTYQPGARTAWHSHPLGQTLIVTAGAGWAQREGGLIEEIFQGDVVYFPPNQRHWHGASPATSMSHITIQEKMNGSSVDWMEHVTDFEYKRGK